MKKRLLLLRMTALLVGLSMAIGASAADVYDFAYNNLQFVNTCSTTAKVVCHRYELKHRYNIHGYRDW